MGLLDNLLSPFKRQSNRATASPAAFNWDITAELNRQRSLRKQQFQRMSPDTVRIVIGNETTDYHWPFQENEVLWEIDFSQVSPMHKYFGRFKNGLFTGIKYNYGYMLNQHSAGKYVESLFEYQDGYPDGLQIYFNSQGDVLRRIHSSESVHTSVPIPA